MKNKLPLLLLIVLIWMLVSCFPEDDMITKHKAGNVNEFQAALTETYKNQIYFDLGDNKIAAQNDKTEWDIAFESSATGFHVILNSARFMKAINTHLTDFNEEYDTTGAKWLFDVSHGDLDSTAIGTWLDTNISLLPSFNELYYIDLGQDDNGNHLGFKKIIFLSVDSATYSFKYANLDGTNEKNATIFKNNKTTFTYFSFSSNTVVNIEPDKNSWDLLFSMYTTTLYDDNNVPTPYLVLGLLLNRNSVEAAFTDSINFDSLTYDYAKNLTFSSKIDYIGYEWKKYDFKAGIYTVLSTRTYVVKDTEGFLYKLRFTKFYNSLGEKGYPTVETQKL